MKDYLCKLCGYIYHPQENKNIDFNDLPDSWVCPVCNATKDEFEELD